MDAIASESALITARAKQKAEDDEAKSIVDNASRMLGLENCRPGPNSTPFPPDTAVGGRRSPGPPGPADGGTDTNHDGGEGVPSEQASVDAPSGRFAAPWLVRVPDLPIMREFPPFTVDLVEDVESVGVRIQLDVSQLQEYEHWDDDDLDTFMTETWEQPTLCITDVYEMMLMIMYRWANVYPGGEHGGYFDPNPYGQSSRHVAEYGKKKSGLKPQVMNILASYFKVDMKNFKQQVGGETYKHFTKGWNGSELDPASVDKLIQTFCVALLSGKDYMAPGAGGVGGGGDGRATKSKRKTRTSTKRASEESLTG